MAANMTKNTVLQSADGRGDVNWSELGVDCPRRNPAIVRTGSRYVFSE